MYIYLYFVHIFEHIVSSLLFTVPVQFVLSQPTSYESVVITINGYLGPKSLNCFWLITQCNKERESTQLLQCFFYIFTDILAAFQATVFLYDELPSASMYRSIAVFFSLPTPDKISDTSKQLSRYTHNNSNRLHKCLCVIHVDSQLNVFKDAMNAEIVLHVNSLKYLSRGH